jgi:hypothetical protein
LTATLFTDRRGENKKISSIRREFTGGIEWGATIGAE